MFAVSYALSTDLVAITAPVFAVLDFLRPLGDIALAASKVLGVFK